MTNDDRAQGASAVCLAKGAAPLSTAATQFLQELTEGRIPSSVPSENLANWSWAVGREPSDTRPVTRDDLLDPRRRLRGDVFPDELRLLIGGLENRLVSYATRVTTILCWRLNVGDAITLINRRIFHDQWSIDDGLSWHPLPRTLRLDLEHVVFARPKRLTDDEKRFIEDYSNDAQVVAGQLAHELLREARQQRGTNPRSAFIMAIAAAEVGLKSFVAKKIPESEWLLENMPSPPIEKIAKELVPQLANEELPKELLAMLRAGVALRNKLVHLGKANISEETLDDTLTAVNKLLYFIDVFYGFTWARDYTH